MFLVACGPDRRVALAEKLMAEKETDSAIAVMQEIKEPQNNLTTATMRSTLYYCPKPCTGNSS